MTPEREKVIRDTWQAYGHRWSSDRRWFSAPAVVPASLHIPIPGTPTINKVDKCEFKLESGHRDNGKTRCERVTCEGIVLEEFPVK
jgi:hypothetical protein